MFEVLEISQGQMGRAPLKVLFFFVAQSERKRDLKPSSEWNEIDNQGVLKCNYWR